MFFLGGDGGLELQAVVLERLDVLLRLLLLLLLFFGQLLGFGLEVGLEKSQRLVGNVLLAVLLGLELFLLRLELGQSGFQI